MFPSTQVFAAQPAQTATTAFSLPHYSQQPVHYVAEQPVQSASQQPLQFVPQQQVQYVYEQPAAYAAQQPMQQYVAEQQAQYMAHEVPQAVHSQTAEYAQPQYFVMPDGQLMEIDQGYATAYQQSLQPSAYEFSAPTLPAPEAEVYNISPEQFAFIARGGAIPDAQLRMLPRAASAAPVSFAPGTYFSAAPPAPVPGAEWARPVAQTATCTPTTAASFLYW